MLSSSLSSDQPTGEDSENSFQDKGIAQARERNRQTEAKKTLSTLPLKKIKNNIIICNRCIGFSLPSFRVCLVGEKVWVVVL